MVGRSKESVFWQKTRRGDPPGNPLKSVHKEHTVTAYFVVLEPAGRMRN